MVTATCGWASMAEAGIGPFAEDAACTDYADGSRHDVDDDGHDDDGDDGLDDQHCYHHQHYRKSYIISKTMQDIENPKSTNQKQMKIEQSDNSTSSSSCFKQLRGIPIPFQLSAYTFLGICMTMHGFLNEECWT